VKTSTRLFQSVAPPPGYTKPVILGIQGPPGGGKTLSALKLARGIRKVRGGRIKVIDTENGRSLPYRAEGMALETPTLVHFDWIPFDPPFPPQDFTKALVDASDDDTAAIIIDSISDEHEGIGGVLEWHEREIDRMLGSDAGNYSRRQAMNQAGWIEPKAARVRLVHQILHTKVPLILTFRAREKVKPVKVNKGGRETTVPTNIGWQPIGAGELVSTCTLNCLLPPRAEGVPTWTGATVQEDFVLKLPDYLKAIFQEPGPINELQGEAIARWAKGEVVSAVHAQRLDPNGRLAQGLRRKAKEGRQPLWQAWGMLNQVQKDAAQELFDELNEEALLVDEAREAAEEQDRQQQERERVAAGGET
jgi:hypothetical protein